uniref:protein SERAC1-like isoform X1 n=1 Tax=Ciona intestinalis TaxID=7719 RepID=UPI000EF4D228|nr:protein SERAC1-like isoform X1 [Ciona intestinalis]|eukprot:XP_026691433.1 protein SERAC1-like isoform X1 [Ciona intestinalis]
MSKQFIACIKLIRNHKGKLQLVAITATGCVFGYGCYYANVKFREKLNIPSNVIENERAKASVYIHNKYFNKRHHDNPNVGYFSGNTRQTIKEIFPAPLARLILLVDRKSVDLAEDYISPWSVLREAYSRNKQIRLNAVEKMAAYTEWSEDRKNSTAEGYVTNRKNKRYNFEEHELESFDIDAEYRTIAQALDSTTLVGLARTNNVDDRFFLPPPELPQKVKNSDVEDLLRELLIKLPQKDVEKCVQYFTSGALTMSDEQKMKRGGLWCFGGNGLNYTRDITPQEEVESFCLQALVKHSKFEEHCEAMVKLGVLPLLQRIRKLRPNSPKIQRNIVRTISNICLYEKLHPQIHQSGWITLLAEISKSGHASLRTQASRGLANLDRDALKDKFNDGVYVLYPKLRSKLKPEADIVFIHGLMGGAFYSWRQQDGVSGAENTTDCWPEDWLPRDLPGCRVMCVEYDTNLSDWMNRCPHEPERHTISYRSRHIMDKVLAAGIGDRPIVWVAHSMGGLIIKHMLSDARENPKKYGKILKKTKGVVFYSTPHFGSQLANYSRKVRRLLFPSVEVMELSHDSPKLKQLNINLQELVELDKIKVMNFGEMQATDIGLGPRIRLHIVPPESADSGIGEFILADKDHLNICKPQSRHSSIYQQTVAFIRSCVTPKRPGEEEEESKKIEKEANTDDLPW